MEANSSYCELNITNFFYKIENTIFKIDIIN